MTDVSGLGGFDWDDGNIVKCQKHGVLLSEIEALFHSTPLTSVDAEHSVAKERYYAVGTTAAGRGLLVVFTWRERDGVRLVRPISARYISRKITGGT